MRTGTALICEKTDSLPNGKADQAKQKPARPAQGRKWDEDTGDCHHGCVRLRQKQCG